MRLSHPWSAPCSVGSTLVVVLTLLPPSASAGPEAFVPMWEAWGEAPMGRSGTSVTAVGDVNGDGYEDLAYSAEDSPSAPLVTGLVQVHLGGPGGPSPTQDRTLAVSAVASPFTPGIRVAAAGDVNGDGFGDLLVGSPYDQTVGTTAGMACLYLGGPEGVGAAPAWVAYGERPQHAFGAQVTTAGDVDGDGFSDVAIAATGYSPIGGAPYMGAVYLFRGSPSGLEAAPAWIAVGPEFSAYLGAALAAGDLDADGYDDLIVSAPYAKGQERGEIQIYAGSPLGLGLTPTTTLIGDAPWANLGLALTAAGDVTGDGVDDLLATALYGEWGGPEDLMYIKWDEARVFLYPGGPAGVASEPMRALGWEPNVHFGYDLDTRQDLNGDGYADLLVSAPFIQDELDDDDPYGGALLAYLGAPGGILAEPSLVALGTQAREDLGLSLSWLDLGGGRVVAATAARRADGSVGTDQGRVALFEPEAEVHVYYPDRDGDGFGDPAGASASPSDPSDVTRPGDCDDAEPTVHAGASEVPGDGIDQDCDGLDTEPAPPGCDSAGGQPGAPLLGLALLFVAVRRRNQADGRDL